MRSYLNIYIYIYIQTRSPKSPERKEKKEISIIKREEGIGIEIERE